MRIFGEKNLKELINKIDSTYLRKSGGSLSGPLDFAPGTENKVGNYAAIADSKTPGRISVKSKFNGANPGIDFVDSSNNTVGNINIEDGKLKVNNKALLTGLGNPTVEMSELVVTPIITVTGDEEPVLNFTFPDFSKIEGTQGEDGVGVSNTEVVYYLGEDPDNIPQNVTWSSIFPDLEQGKYLWTKTTLQYSDGTSKDFFTVAYQGMDGETGPQGEKGDKGDQGDKGAQISDAEITYQVGESSWDLPTGAWTKQIPFVEHGKYLWTKVILKYSDGTSSKPIYSVGYHGQDGQPGPQGAKGDPGTGIARTVVSYAVNTDGSVVPDSSSWSSLLPETEPGEFLWSKTEITYTDATLPSTVYSVSRQGEDGETGPQGEKGDQGVPGVAGKGISAREVRYAVADNGISVPSDNEFTLSIPFTETGKYLWTRTIDTYTDGTTAPAVYSIGYFGLNGEKGETGAKGDQGTSIVKTEISYQVGEFPHIPPTSAWTSVVPEDLTPGKYLWTKTEFSFNDGTAKKTVYSVAYQGAVGPQGEKGDKGDPGISGNGIKSVDVYYQPSISGSITPGDSGWETSVPTVEKGMYLWTKSVINYTTNTSAPTIMYSVSYMGADGPQGEQGAVGNPGTSITNIEISYKLDEGSANGLNGPGDWSETMPYMKPGDSVWVKHIFVYSNGIKSNPVYTVTSKGATGPQGEQGATGPQGKQGVAGANATIYRYCGNYEDNREYVNNDDYIDTVTFEGTTYVCIQDCIGEPVDNLAYWRVFAAKGDTGPQGFTGPQGEQGRAGVGIMNATVYYKTSEDGTIPADFQPRSRMFRASAIDNNDETWTTTPPTVTEGQYLMSKTVVDFTDGTSQTMYGAGYNGVNGAQGPQGFQGAQGPQGFKGDKGVSLRVQGEYNPTSVYVNNASFIDIVTYNGSMYACRETAVEGKTPTEIEYWYLLAQKGNPGATGPQGFQGEKGLKGEDGTSVTVNSLINGTGTNTYSSSGIVYAKIGDVVINPDNGNVYRCTVGGGASVAQWQYQNNIKGPQGEQGPQGFQGIDGKSAAEFRYRGEFELSTSYVNNGSYIDIVTYNGSSYICRKTTKNINIDNTEYWGLFVAQGAVGPQGSMGVQGPQGNPGDPGKAAPVLRFRGEYLNDSSYVNDDNNIDIVFYNGSSYICKKSTVRNNPTSTEHWGLFTSQGLVGPQGLIGPQGLQGPQGPVGANGVNGTNIYQGDKITGVVTSGVIFANSNITFANTGDLYINTVNGNVYSCLKEGPASLAMWGYTMNIKGVTGAPGKSYWSMGVWSPNTNYISDNSRTDVVVYDGSAYACTSTNTGQTPAAGSAYWTLLVAQGTKGESGISMRWMGSWNRETTYVNDGNFIDIVEYESTSYGCLRTNTGTVPGTSISDWAVVAAQGVQGYAAGFGQPTYNNTEANQYGQAKCIVTVDNTSSNLTKVFDFKFLNLKGNGINGHTVQYNSTTADSTTPPSTGWSNTVITPTRGTFMWTKNEVSFNDGSKQTSYVKGYYGTDASLAVQDYTPVLNYGAQFTVGKFTTNTINGTPNIYTTTVNMPGIPNLYLGNANNLTNHNSGTVQNPKFNLSGGGTTSNSLGFQGGTNISIQGTNGLVTIDNTYAHPKDGGNVGTFGNTTSAPDYGGTFNIPRFETNEFGHVTSASNQTITMPGFPEMYLGSSDAIANGTNVNNPYLIIKDADTTHVSKVQFTGGTYLTATASAGNLTFKHNDSGVTKGTYGSDTASPSHSGSFNIPKITVDAQGHVTGASNSKITLPAQYSHYNQGPNKTVGAQGAASGYNATFQVPKITINSEGHVTSATEYTISMPDRQTLVAAAGTNIAKVGTPTVSQSVSGNTTTFTFNYLKGETGPQGDTGPAGTYSAGNGINISGSAISLASTFSVSGSISAESFWENSDRTIKENINPISDTDKVSKVDFKEFNFISDENKTKKYGVIAQELEEIGLNNLVNNGGKIKSVDYISLIILKLQQQDDEIKKLKEIIQELKK